jgi:ATP-binding cassette, subfamily B, bacterial
VTGEIKKRDKQIAHAIHRIFREAHFQQKWSLFIGVACRQLSTICMNVLMPFFAALGVQAIIIHDSAAVIRYVWLVIAAGLAYAVFSSVGEALVAKNAVSANKYLMRQTLETLLGKDYEFFTNKFSGTLGGQLVALRDGMILYGELFTLQLPNNLTILAGGIIMIGYFSLPLALITLVVVVIVIGVQVIGNRWRVKFRRELSSVNSVIAGQAVDTLSHGDAVKSNGREKFELGRFDIILRQWEKQQLKTWITMIPVNDLRAVTVSVSTACVLLMSMYLYSSGAISVAIVVLVQLYVIRLVFQTLFFGEMVKSYEQAMSMAYSAVESLLVTPKITDPAEPANLARLKSYNLSLDNISFAYSVGQPALSNLTLTVRQGEKIGVVGHSGGGKTTLSKLLLRFMDVSAGSIKIGGVDIRDISQEDLRTLISYVPQEPLLFHRSIQENVEYGKPDAPKAQIEKAVKAAYVDEFVKDLPEELDTLVGERGIKLSGGQRQRVTIARALLKDAPILVLDEATSALDSKSEKYIQDALWKLMKGRTAIVIAHRLSTIQRMDRIVVLDKGKIVQIGTHDQLKNQSGIYAELWTHQSGGYIGLPSNDEEDKSDS